jgi:acetate kinase
VNILVLNSGSSSQKTCLFRVLDSLPEYPPKPLWEAKIEWNEGWAEVQIKAGEKVARKDRLKVESRRQALGHLLGSLWHGDTSVVAQTSEIGVVGHRIVHGGDKFQQPVIVTSEVKQGLAGISDFAPLHNRAELEGMEIVGELLGPVPQVAVFDTHFHRNLPLAAVVYPGPYEWYERGIRRYGFHGINHEYCAERAAQLLRKRSDSLKLISCHLGNGCSLAAIDGGRSIDTTVGFTPLEGLMMGTRSGSVDPGILTYLMHEQEISGLQLDDLLNNKSGLLGISGVSSDMRQVLGEMKSGNERAELAFQIFIHRLRSGIGSMLAALGGLDALIFTAGIGENSPVVREAACDAFRFLGLNLDPQKNDLAPADSDIAAQDSSARVLVIRAQEDWAIARKCWEMYERSC